MTMLRQTARILTVISLLQLASLISFPPGERESVAITSYICPEYFSEDAVGKMNCSVNTTEVMDSSCLPYPTMVDFNFRNTSLILLCSAPYNGKCDEEPVGEINCSCVESDGEMFLYQLNFRGNRTVYEGGDLSCYIRCSSPFGTYSTGSQTCAHLNYGEPTEITSPSTLSNREVTTDISTMTALIQRTTTATTTTARRETANVPRPKERDNS